MKKCKRRFPCLNKAIAWNRAICIVTIAERRMIVILKKSKRVTRFLFWKKKTAFTMIETVMAFLVTLSGIVLLFGVMRACKLQLDEKKMTERFQYSRVLNVLYSDQLDLTELLLQDSQKRWTVMYYSSKTKKYYDLERYSLRSALVMEAYDESSGKMPLMYDVENFKTDASKGKWPVLTLTMKDGNVFRHVLMLPTKCSKDGKDFFDETKSTD